MKKQRVRNKRLTAFDDGTRGYYLVSLNDLYRVPRYKKPRKARRLKRKRARWWASLSPEEQALYTFLWNEMRQELRAEEDRQILWGDGTEPTELKGILNDAQGNRIRRTTEEPGRIHRVACDVLGGGRAPDHVGI